LSRYIHTVKKTAEALLVASKVVDIEVNAEKTKYLNYKKSNQDNVWNGTKVLM